MEKHLSNHYLRSNLFLVQEPFFIFAPLNASSCQDMFLKERAARCCFWFEVEMEKPLLKIPSTVIVFSV